MGIVATTGAFYLGKNKLGPKLRGISEALTDISTKETLPPINLDVGEEIDEGDYKTVKVVGTLTNTRINDSHYLFELNTTIDNRNINLSVDLGEADFRLNILTIQPNSNGHGEGFYENYESVPTKEVFAEYQNKIGNKISITIITDIKKQPANCNITCKSRLNLFDQYKTNNQFLASNKANLTSSQLKVGFVSTISDSPYEL